MKKIISIFFLISILFFPQDIFSTPSVNPLRIHFIDVGYGDAILIEFPDASTMMIDAAEAHYADNVLAYLQSLNIQRIDTAIITHPHVNHFEGFSLIVEHMPIGRVLINGDANTEEGYEELLEVFNKKSIAVKKIVRGDLLDQLPLDIIIKILHPKELDESVNNNSIVLKLSYKNKSILFMGDVEINAQEKLFEEFADLTDVDYVKVPHHGGPLSEQFIQKFKNTDFIISTGPNEWGLPDDNALSRLSGKILRTDTLGTIILQSDGEAIEHVIP
ncbi:hypothetical protein MNBD_UNCLBAC01-579 [hydrothermal vent metagenome]|uniref:Metallo-beta-lactamase domain-containing protein n=1 Tax=hydrothermal vent metagenome TaxID=652676 RepID=A0A3B1DPV9_9ZZZZ